MYVYFCVPLKKKSDVSTRLEIYSTYLYELYIKLNTGEWQVTFNSMFAHLQKKQVL